MSDRTFTLEEAQSLLPYWNPFSATLLKARTRRNCGRRISGTGPPRLPQRGTHLDILKLARRKAEREKAVQSVKDSLAEIDSTGVQVKTSTLACSISPVKSRAASSCFAGNWEKRHHPLAQRERRFRRRKPIDERISKAKRTN